MRTGTLWRVPLVVVCIVLGAAVLLLSTVAVVICVPDLRKAVLDKGIVIASEQTGMDIEVGDIYLSPFHHSPVLLYRAYKGEADLPLEVKIDNFGNVRIARDSQMDTNGDDEDDEV